MSPEKELDLLREFAREVVNYFEYDQEWYQCPWCLWCPDREWDPEHNGCSMVDVAALLGLAPKGAVGEAVAEVLA